MPFQLGTKPSLPIEYSKMSSPLSQLSNDQLMDIIQYLGADEFKALRLAGSKDMCLSDPKLTNHLQLRMDRVPFFCENDIQFSEEFVRRWLDNRSRLVINDANACWSPSRVTYLAANGFLDSITDIVVYDCHHHRKIIEILSNLTSVKTLMLVDQSSQRETVEDLEAIISYVGNMHSLTTLDVEFGAVVHGSRLTFLKELTGLRTLKLVGFDLSEGIRHVSGLTSLSELQLCHGNCYSSPSDDVNEKDLMDLIGLNNLRRLHLEGFDCLTGAGLAPFSANGTIQDLVIKHCQESSEECLRPIGRMTHLTSLHFVLSSCDDIDVWTSESLHHLNALSSLESLSFFYVLDGPADLRALPGLTALRTLNLAFEETLDETEMENLCATVLEIFPSVQTLRIFSEDDLSEDRMDCFYHYCGLDVEYAKFNFGDLVCLD
ncbi:hypothetical protein ACHAWF_007318 [Thalassiosira exigua]